jgi:XRE family aerobic/anaerobic benzoate catabolism transcriptional regulator
MDDLRRILDGRAAFYSKADLIFDTSQAPLPETFQALRQQIDQALHVPRSTRDGAASAQRSPG